MWCAHRHACRTETRGAHLLRICRAPLCAGRRHAAGALRYRRQVHWSVATSAEPWPRASTPCATAPHGLCYCLWWHVAGERIRASGMYAFLRPRRRGVRIPGLRACKYRSLDFDFGWTRCQVLQVLHELCTGVTNFLQSLVDRSAGFEDKICRPPGETLRCRFRPLSEGERRSGRWLFRFRRLLAQMRIRVPVRCAVECLRSLTPGRGALPRYRSAFSVWRPGTLAAAATGAPGSSPGSSLSRNSGAGAEELVEERRSRPPGLAQRGLTCLGGLRRRLRELLTRLLRLREEAFEHARAGRRAAASLISF